MSTKFLWLLCGTGARRWYKCSGKEKEFVNVEFGI